MFMARGRGDFKDSWRTWTQGGSCKIHGRKRHQGRYKSIINISSKFQEKTILGNGNCKQNV